MEFLEPALAPLNVLLEWKRALVFLTNIVGGTGYCEIYYARRDKWHRLEAVDAVDELDQLDWTVEGYEIV